MEKKHEFEILLGLRLLWLHAKQLKLENKRIRDDLLIYDFMLISGLDDLENLEYVFGDDAISIMNEVGHEQKN